MIDFDHVTKDYGTNNALDNVTIHIDKGEFVFVVGPSGAGKSTFIKLILREITPTRGNVTVNGKIVNKLSKREIPQYRRKVGVVFQDCKLLPNKTITENIEFAMEILHKSKRQIKKQVPLILNVVGIGDKGDRYPAELSGGEEQRAAIARAIVNVPDLLIADEPTGNLDPKNAKGIMDLLLAINARGTTVVMVTHAKDIVDRLDKRVITIDDGSIVSDRRGKYDVMKEAENA